MHRPNGAAGTVLRSAPLWVAALILQLLPTQAEEVHIASPEALAEALGRAAPGDVLLLEPGDYGAVTVKGGGGASGRPVTLRSADPARPARIASLDLERAANLAFEDMTFDYQFSPDDPPFLRVFRVVDSRDIAFRRLQVDGDVAHSLSPVENGYGFAYAFGIEASRNIKIEDCEIKTFSRGIIVGQSKDISIRNNEIFDLRSDGMNFAGVENVLIAENYIHDFRTSPNSDDHPDMIQFWTTGTAKPSSNIRINNNVLSSGRGPETQSIFMRNERVDTGDSGRSMFYRGIEVSGNVIINAHVHGITIGEADGVLISRNTLIQNVRSLKKPSYDLVWVPMINVAGSSENVTIIENAVDRINGFAKQASWVVVGNIHIQNRTRVEGGFYGRIFSNALVDPDGDISTYAYRPGEALDRSRAGAPRLRSKLPALPGPRR